MAVAITEARARAERVAKVSLAAREAEASAASRAFTAARQGQRDS